MSHAWIVILTIVKLMKPILLAQGNESYFAVAR
jgi:hypothetical protein